MLFCGIMIKESINKNLTMSDLNINSDQPHPTGESTSPLEQAGVLRSIMQRVGATFGLLNKNRSIASLQDHAVETFPELESMITQITEIKTELEETIGDDLRPHVLAIINPMLRQLHRLRSQAENGKLDPNNSWLAKAKVWQQLRGKPSNRPIIIRSLIEHVKHEVEQSVKQDLHVIQVYLRHRMDTLRLPDAARKAAEQTLHSKLRTIGETMRSLALAPALGSIKALGEWRREVDCQRQKHHDKALELIDKHLN